MACQEPPVINLRVNLLHVPQSNFIEHTPLYSSVLPHYDYWKTKIGAEPQSRLIVYVVEEGDEDSGYCISF